MWLAREAVSSGLGDWLPRGVSLFFTDSARMQPPWSLSGFRKAAASEVVEQKCQITIYCPEWVQAQAKQRHWESPFQMF